MIAGHRPRHPPLTKVESSSEGDDYDDDDLETMTADCTPRRCVSCPSNGQFTKHYHGEWTYHCRAMTTEVVDAAGPTYVAHLKDATKDAAQRFIEQYGKQDFCSVIGRRDVDVITVIGNKRWKDTLVQHVDVFLKCGTCSHTHATTPQWASDACA